MWSRPRRYGLRRSPVRRTVSVKEAIAIASKRSTYSADGTVKRKTANGEDFADFDDEITYQEKLHFSAVSN